MAKQRIMMTKEERRRRRRKDLAFAILMSFVIIVLMGFSFVAGYYTGTRVTVKYFMDAMALMIKSSDIKIVANMSINETKMIDYMFEKMGQPDIQKKEYIPPCNPDPSIPKGETSRCVEQQVIKK
jgi:uncharacterized protein YneF (UPF0154 family)